MRTSLRAATTVLVAAVLLTASACVPPPAPADPATCPAPAAGTIRVAVVVDASALPGGAATPSVVCVGLPTGSTGLQALQARAAKLGTPAPRIGGSGLICAIDGEPAAPACGESGPNGFQFWGYFVGGATWGFAPVGPAGRVLVDGSVDGWSFQNGPGSPPATSASFAQLTN